MKKIYTFNNGVEIEMSFDEAHSAAHSGRCDEDVEYLAGLPHIKAQLEGYTCEEYADELRGYGAWDETELQDYEANKLRILWLAAWGILEENEEEAQP